MNIGYRDGLMTHIDGPRADVVDVTSFEYDKLGRVISINTPDGRRTRVLHFDKYGRPTQLQTGEAQPTTRLRFTRQCHGSESPRSYCHL